MAPIVLTIDIASPPDVVFATGMSSPGTWQVRRVDGPILWGSNTRSWR